MTLPDLSKIKNPDTREQRRTELVESFKKWGRGRKIDHMLDLDDRYPEVGMFDEQCISADVGAGWAGLVENVLKVLSEHGCKVTQIKQKFAGLRIYWQFGSEIEAAIDEWRKLNPQHLNGEDGEWTYDPPMPFPEERKKIAEAVGPVVAAAEALSFQTCEDCGLKLEKAGGPKCGRTQCDLCASALRW